MSLPHDYGFPPPACWFRQGAGSRTSQDPAGRALGNPWRGGLYKAATPDPEHRPRGPVVPGRCGAHQMGGMVFHRLPAGVRCAAAPAMRRRSGSAHESGAEPDVGRPSIRGVDRRRLRVAGRGGVARPSLGWRWAGCGAGTGVGRRLSAGRPASASTGAVSRHRLGTPTVLAATRRRLRRSGADWAELSPGWDVDTPADLRRLRRVQAGESITSASPKYSAV